MGDPVKCPNGYCNVPQRTFQMGSTNGDSDERPVGKVTVSSHKMRKTEVTIGEYRAFLGRTAGIQLKAVVSGCGTTGTSKTLEGKPGEAVDQLRGRAAQVFLSDQCNEVQVVQQSKAELPLEGYCGEMNRKSGDHPVVCVTRDEAEAFCRSEGAELPTAAQYESAATVDGKYGTPIDKAIIYENGYTSTAPVCGPKEERANSLGICDLTGNVWERVRDRYESDYYSRMPEKDPYNPITNPEEQTQEFRGGSFVNIRGGVRAANRYGGGPGFRSFYDGFRCARSRPQDFPKK